MTPVVKEGWVGGFQGHTIKPGKREHGTPAERRNNAGTPAERRNNTGTLGRGTTERGTPAEYPKHHGTTAEYRNNDRIPDNGTPQKLEPEDKHDIFLSGGISVRIPQELDVVAFWSWNLDVVVF